MHTLAYEVRACRSRRASHVSGGGRREMLDVRVLEFKFLFPSSLLTHVMLHVAHCSMHNADCRADPSGNHHRCPCSKRRRKPSVIAAGKDPGLCVGDPSCCSPYCNCDCDFDCRVCFSPALPPSSILVYFILLSRCVCLGHLADFSRLLATMHLLKLSWSVYGCCLSV